MNGAPNFEVVWMYGPPARDATENNLLDGVLASGMVSLRWIICAAGKYVVDAWMSVRYAAPAR